MIKKIINWWQSLRFYVIADPADNSVTLSKALFNHIKDNAHEGDPARVFMFRVGDNYAFMANPDIQQPTQLCHIQYNDKYKCIGFETLCPSVGKILYDYMLPANKFIRLSVDVKKTPQGNIYYQLHKPHEKSVRKFSQA